MGRGARRVTALYDANVLYPAPIRDLLIRVSRAGVVGARWTARIHDEWMRNLLENRSDITPARLQRTLQLMEKAVPGAVVEDYEHHIPRLTLPDPGDRHVLAAAIEARADVIVTFNLKHFPVDALRPHRIEVQHPDSFVLDLLGQHPEVVRAAVRTQQMSLRKPPLTVGEHLGDLAKSGLPRTAEALRRLGSDG
jgi:predicted nucleic acid-binding protein